MPALNETDRIEQSLNKLIAEEQQRDRAWEERDWKVIHEPAQPAPPLPDPELRLLDDVDSQATQWLWPGRVALGQLTLVAGEPGAGTSLLLMDLASRVSRGAVFPQGNAHSVARPAGRVPLSGLNEGGAVASAAGRVSGCGSNNAADVVLIMRQSMEHVVKQRLAVLGADMKRIRAMGEVHERVPGQETPKVRPFRAFSDLAHLESLLARTPGVKLVVLDPLEVGLDERGRNISYNCRQTLRKLGELAQRCGVAIVAAARAPEKPGANDLRRWLDKLAGVEELGMLFAVVRDRRRPCRRYLVAVKNTLADTEDALKFETPGGRVAWGRGGVSAAVFGATAGRLDQQDAAVWLRGELAEGPKTANELRAAADESGIPWHVVYRAKAIAGAVGYRKGFGPGSHVFWRLEEDEADAEVDEASRQPDQKEPDFTIENENPGISGHDDLPCSGHPLSGSAPRGNTSPDAPRPHQIDVKPDTAAERPHVRSHAERGNEINPGLAGFQESDEPIRMPWGKYKGAPIEALEHHYLKEVLSWHRKRLDDELFQEIERVLRQRP